MDNSHQLPGVVLCPGCGSPNSEGGHFCAKCAAPLSWYATTDPLATVFAEGYAARRAVMQPHKPIVLVGLWLWMFPIAMFTVAGLLCGLFAIFEGLSTWQLDMVFGGLLGIAVSSVFLAFSVPMLYKGTKNYLRMRSQRTINPDRLSRTEGSQGFARRPTESDTEEALTCMACGRMMANNTLRCPDCGWSYSSGSAG
jgi:hypothetical protein